jgi:hypothetical protein
MKLVWALALLLSQSVWGLTSSQPALDVEWDSVALIKTEARDTEGGEVPAYCNATFLNAQTLVTAAHCVHHAQVLNSFSVEISVGYYKYATKPDGTTYRVGYVTRTKKTVPARFYFTNSLRQKIASSGLKAKINPGEDLAAIILSEAFPLESTFPFVKMASQSEFEGLKKIATQYAPTVVSINFFEEMSNDTKRQAQLNNLTWNSALHFESRSTSRVQEGDSGSPLLARIGTAWKVIGVVKGLAQTVFSSWDVYAGIGQNICEISPQVPAPYQKDLCY